MGTYVVSTSGGGQPGCESGSHLVDSVAAAFGGVDEDNMRVQALDCVNRARNEINMHDWRFLKRTISSTAFVASTATYSLPTSFKSPGFFRILDSAGKVYADLRYMDDAAFVHWLPQQNATGLPYLYSLRNTFNDGLVTFYPVPDATAASTYTFTGEYYTRIDNIADDNTALSAIPEEICNVIIAGGQYYMASEREKGNQGIINLKLADYQRIKNLALVNDRRMTDNTGDRFKMPGSRLSYDSRNWYGYFGWR